MKTKSASLQKRLLLPVDGSQRCLETVRHVARYQPFHAMGVVLFNVFSDVPDCYWDLEREPKSVKTVRHVRAWVVQKKKEMEDYLESARQILLRGGFDRKAISVSLHSRKKGVARDIIAEARKGYTAVVIRRRGITGLRNIVLGSVAAKLMERLSFVPLIIVGKKPVTRRVLIGVDGSEGAARAIRFAAQILDGHGFSAYMVNVIRAMGGWGVSRGGALQDALHPLKAEEEIIPVLNDAEAQLLDLGFSPEKVTWKVVAGARSRAAALVEEAGTADCDTIIVGRRGLTDIKDFFIGRVSNKVVHLARKNTVWVVT
jgi:nucleotide-binding universal stress UspA family protein